MIFVSDEGKIILSGTHSRKVGEIITVIQMIAKEAIEDARDAWSFARYIYIGECYPIELKIHL